MKKVMMGMIVVMSCIGYFYSVSNAKPEGYMLIKSCTFDGNGIVTGYECREIMLTAPCNKSSCE